jgi:hypothetical protein
MHHDSALWARVRHHHHQQQQRQLLCEWVDETSWPRHRRPTRRTRRHAKHTSRTASISLALFLDRNGMAAPDPRRWWWLLPIQTGSCTHRSSTCAHMHVCNGFSASVCARQLTCISIAMQFDARYCNTSSYVNVRSAVKLGLWPSHTSLADPPACLAHRRHGDRARAAPRDEQRPTQLTTCLVDLQCDEPSDQHHNRHNRQDGSWNRAFPSTSRFQFPSLLSVCFQQTFEPNQHTHNPLYEPVHHHHQVCSQRSFTVPMPAAAQVAHGKSNGRRKPSEHVSPHHAHCVCCLMIVQCQCGLRGPLSISHPFPRTSITQPSSCS